MRVVPRDNIKHRLDGDDKLNKIIVSVGAHPDDVEQGMGGSLAKHSAHGDDVHIILCTLGGVSGNPMQRLKEAEVAAGILDARLHVLDFPIAKLNKPSTEFYSVIRKAISDIRPDRVYVHSPFDYHQIHVSVSECVTRSAKDVKQLLYYEDISSTNPDFKANAYVDISNYIDLKLDSIAAHATQSNKVYLGSNIMKSLAYTRYVMGKLGSNPFGMAEAFTIHKFFIEESEA